MDGGNVRDSIENTGSGQNFSQEVVQEFQLSSVNFDLSTGITAVGSVNIVTRSGGNDFHGSGYFFFRDHNMAAYPGLARNPLALDPFFARRNPGFWVGGPIIKNKLFFFFNYEYQNQLGAVTFQPNLASFSALTGTYFSPYKGKTLSGRFDYKLNDKHSLFARYSHDGNVSNGPSGGAQYPSNWVVNSNWADQSILGITSALKPNLVNDFRFSYQYWHNRNLFPTASDCPGCLAIGDGTIAGQLGVSGGNITIGHSTNATQGRDLRKYQFTDGLTWQKGAHRMRFGGEYEHAPGTGFWGYCDPFCGSVLSPEATRANLIPVLGAATFNALFPKLPTAVKTYDDFLNLPFLGAVIGVGDPSQPPPYNIDKAKPNDRVRLYFQDTWRLTPKFNLSYGLAWNYESNLVNKDIPKPAFLAPLYGTDLSASTSNKKNFSPVLGFTWNPFKDNKTVIRGGGGIYYDTEYLYQRLQERAVIGPVGNGRQQFPSSGLTNIFPGILNFSNKGAPVPVGAPLPQGLLNLTTAQFLQIYNAQIPAINAKFASTGNTDLTVRNIDITKSGAQIYPRDYPTLQAIHLNFGFQRELRRDLVLSVDYARRVFLHVADQTTFDFNRYNRFINGVRTPVIPACNPPSSTPGVECSNGQISFWLPGFRTVYNAMLVKLDKRFAKRYQFTASYALQSQHGNNGIVNGDNWNQTYGPQNSRHLLNISGLVDLPWGFNIGFISSTASTSPAMPSVNNVDLFGSPGGTASSPLPGLNYNCINRDCSKDDIRRAVDNFNSTYVGKLDIRGATITPLILPADFNFGRTFQSQDIRLTKTLTIRERYKFSIFAEMFNVLNYSNYGGASTTLDTKNSNPALQTFSFGQYTRSGLRIGRTARLADRRPLPVLGHLRGGQRYVIRCNDGQLERAARFLVGPGFFLNPQRAACSRASARPWLGQHRPREANQPCGAGDLFLNPQAGHLPIASVWAMWSSDLLFFLSAFICVYQRLIILESPSAWRPSPRSRSPAPAAPASAPT